MSEVPHESGQQNTDLASVFEALHHALKTGTPVSIETFGAESWPDPVDLPSIESVAGDDDDSIVMALRSLKNVLGLGDDISVVNPGSHVVVSVARVFGKEQVTHVDPDERAIDCLQRNGFEAVNARIEDYVPPTQHDLLVP